MRYSTKEIEDLNRKIANIENELSDIRNLITHNVSDFARFSDIINILPIESNI